MLQSLLMLVVPDALGWALAAAAQNVPMMVVARMLNGFAAAGYAPSIQVKWCFKFFIGIIKLFPCNRCTWRRLPSPTPAAG